MLKGFQNRSRKDEKQSQVGVLRYDLNRRFLFEMCNSLHDLFTNNPKTLSPTIPSLEWSLAILQEKLWNSWKGQTLKNVVAIWKKTTSNVSDFLQNEAYNQCQILGFCPRKNINMRNVCVYPYMYFWILISLDLKDLLIVTSDIYSYKKKV